MITLVELDAEIAVIKAEEERLWQELKRLEAPVNLEIETAKVAWLAERKKLQREQQRREVLAEMMEAK